jgi:hypothetical protein
MLRLPDVSFMLAHLSDLLGPSAANWLLVIVSGLIFLAAAAFLPTLVNRCRGRSGPPLL